MPERLFWTSFRDTLTCDIFFRYLWSFEPVCGMGAVLIAVLGISKPPCFLVVFSLTKEEGLVKLKTKNLKLFLLLLFCSIALSLPSLSFAGWTIEAVDAPKDRQEFWEVVIFYKGLIAFMETKGLKWTVLAV